MSLINSSNGPLHSSVMIITLSYDNLLFSLAFVCNFFNQMFGTMGRIVENKINSIDT